MAGVDNNQGRVIDPSGGAVIPTIRPGDPISAGRLLNPLVHRVNSLAIKAGARQITRRRIGGEPGVPDNIRYVRFRQSNAKMLAASDSWDALFAVDHDYTILEAHQFGNGDFSVRFSVNDTLTGPTITDASTNPIDMQSPTTTLAWDEGDYLKLEVISEGSPVAVSEFELVLKIQVD